VREPSFSELEGRLITGISDIVQVYMRYCLSQSDRQILFNFKIFNMTPFLLENILIDFEGNLAALPYPDTSRQHTIM